MIAVFVTLRLGDSFDAESLQRISESAAPRFGAVPGLHSKTFCVDAVRRVAVNVYLWEEESAARVFFGADAIERITLAYGVRPEIAFADVLARVENP
jgi:hypothetical protein